jgi:hypothetical protein
MITGTDLKKSADPAVRRAVVTIPRKRRSKFVPEMTEAAPSPEPIVPTVSRHPRMKRSGPMLLHLRSVSDNGCTNTARISPETLRAFNQAIGALRKSSAKRPAHAVA